jgi:hypothetical protein
MINLAKTPANIGTPSYHAVYYLTWALLVHERESVPLNCLSSMTHLYPELSPGRDLLSVEFLILGVQAFV